MLFLSPESQVLFRSIRSVLNPVTDGVLEKIPMNFSSTDKEYFIQAILPGFNREEINVSMEDGVLTIKAQKTKTEEVEGQEKVIKHFVDWDLLPQKNFVQIPRDANVEGISLTLENGILLIKIPKNVSEPKSFEIK